MNAAGGEEVDRSLIEVEKEVGLLVGNAVAGGEDVLLVDMFSGRVVQVIRDVFW